MISIYRFLLSPFLGQVCRFHPNCSQYSQEVFQKYGLLKGLFYTFKRLLSCHPFRSGGIDPIP